MRSCHISPPCSECVDTFECGCLERKGCGDLIKPDDARWTDEGRDLALCLDCLEPPVDFLAINKEFST